MVELAHRVAKAFNEEIAPNPEIRFSHVVAGMGREHLITLLKDRPGIILCGNVPGSELTRKDYIESEAQCVLYILTKSPKDRQGTEEEFDQYAVLQHLMSKLCEILMGKDAFSMLCQSGRMTVDELNVEPEYNEFGGFNGWSVGFRLPDGKGTSLG